MVEEKKCRVDTVILVLAMRYMLNSKIHSPRRTIEAIKENIEHFNSTDLRILIKDVEDYLGEFASRKYYGTTWMNFKILLERELRHR